MDWVALQPAIELVPPPGHAVRIAYVKNGTDGINVYGRYAGEEVRTLLGRSTRSPFFDRRPPRQAGEREDREYHAYHMRDDEQIGQHSTTATITTRE